MLYRLVEGARIEPLDVAWACFSPLSGETVLLNTEAAAILELLANHGPTSDDTVARILAADTRTDIADVTEALRHAWDQLIAAGLVRTDAAHEYQQR